LQTVADALRVEMDWEAYQRLVPSPDAPTLGLSARAGRWAPRLSRRSGQHRRIV